MLVETVTRYNNPVTAASEKMHARVEGMETALCGLVERDDWSLVNATWTDFRGWKPVADADPTCKRCLERLEAARTRAAGMLPPEQADPGQALTIVVSDYVRLSEVYGRPDFDGYRIVVQPEHTFYDLSLAIHGLLIYDLHGEAHDEANLNFFLPDGRHVFAENSWGWDWPRSLVVSQDARVSDQLGRGDHFDYSWRYNTLRCRVQRAATEVVATGRPLLLTDTGLEAIEVFPEMDIESLA